MEHRPERIGKLLRVELSALIGKEIELGDQLITITTVSVSKDLHAAKVGVSVLPSDEVDKILEELKKKAKYFRHLLIKKVRIRRIPEIHFEHDPGPQRAAVIEKLLLEDQSEES